MTAGVSRGGRSICSDLEGAAVDSQTFAVTVAGYIGLPAVTHTPKKHENRQADGDGRALGAVGRADITQ